MLLLGQAGSPGAGEAGKGGWDPAPTPLPNSMGISPGLNRRKKNLIIRVSPVHLTGIGFLGGIDVSLDSQAEPGTQTGNSIHTSALGALNPCSGWTGGGDWGTEWGQQRSDSWVTLDFFFFF